MAAHAWRTRSAARSSLTLVTAIEIADQLRVGFVTAAGTNMDDMGGKIAAMVGGLGSINLAASGAGAILTIFLSDHAASADLDSPSVLLRVPALAEHT